MPATYEKTNTLNSIISELIETKDYHNDLNVVGVTVQTVFYIHDERLKVRGVHAYAYIKLTNLRERALGQRDATLVVDKAAWDVMDDDRRVALVDHELYHLAVLRDKDNKLSTDDLNRPKMRLRKHDVEVGWFVQIAQEHGRASIEVMQATEMAHEYRQSLFAFALKDAA